MFQQSYCWLYLINQIKFIARAATASLGIFIAELYPSPSFSSFVKTVLVFIPTGIHYF